MVEFTIGDIINVNSNVDAGEGETISVYKWKWNNTEFGENTNNISIDTSDMSAGNYNLSLEVQNSCDSWSVPYSEVITLLEALDPCEGIVCENICIDYNLYSQKCVDGECVPDQLIEENSSSCGYIPPEIEEPIDPCENVICPDYCDDINHIKYTNGHCVNGECIYDTIEENSVECGYIPPEIEEPIDEKEEPFDVSKIYGLLAGIGLGAILLFKK